MLSTIFETNFQKRSLPFDFVPEFPEILVKWIAPFDSVNRDNFTHVNSRKKLARQGGWPFYPWQLFSI